MEFNIIIIKIIVTLLVKFEFARKYPENKEIDDVFILAADCYYQLNDYERSINHYKEYLETPSNSVVDKISNKV